MSPHDITTLLHAHANGDDAAFDQLLAGVYDELRMIARARLRRERAGHTLAPTDLVHEAFMRLVKTDHIDWKDRAHFFAIASRAMRNVLVDYAVRRGAIKRGGGAHALALEDAHASTSHAMDELLALEQALTRLERIDERQARVVECRFFGGLSIDETAEALQISPATVSRDWTFARAWLNHELAHGR